MLSCFRKKNIVSPIESINEPINGGTIERIKNVKKLEFCNFNYPVINLPNSIESIDFCYSNGFNHSLDNLPIGLKELVLNSRFNQPLDYLPHGLEILKFQTGSIFTHYLNNLPNTLKILEIPLLYNQEINNLPECLQELRIGVKIMKNDDVCYLPEGFDYCANDTIIFFDKKIKNLPKNLKKVFVFDEYMHIADLKQKLGGKLYIISKETYIKK